MAEENDSQEKTEDPTARRISEARKQGQVALSRDASGLLGLIAGYLALQLVAPYLWTNMQIITIQSFSSFSPDNPFTITSLHHGFLGLLSILLPPIYVLLIITAFFASGSTLLQTKFLWTMQLLKPKMIHINPINGIKKIFSINNYIQVAKSLAKLAIISPIAFFAFKDLFPELVGLMKIPLSQFFPYTIFAMDYIFWEIVKYLIVLAILDVIWQRYYTNKQMKMSKAEVKDERKAMEGDEATKRKILAIGLQRARQRMYADIPTADVVVTNPTHYAVALSYSMEPGKAPKVVAKGKNFVAQRIKEIAKENGVPVIERKPLARALFASVEVGMEIPYELYHAVAELLAYVYKIKGKRLHRKK